MWNTFKILVGSNESSFRRPRRTWEYSVHMDLIYLITPWSRVLEKLSGSQLVKKFTVFYETRRFIAAFTSARHLSLSWALRRILRRLYGRSGTWLIWLRIGTNGGPLRTWNWSFGFYKIPGISWVTEELLASEEELLSHGVRQLVSKTVVWSTKEIS